jgi:DNA gyrase/topoisomerase IV subunit B
MSEDDDAALLPEYAANAINILPAVGASVRRRPAMYFGDAGERGLHALLWEVVSNAIDQYLAGRTGTIHVDLHGERGVSVRDDGPGIRTSSADDLARLLTELHRTPTRDGHSPHVHVGGSCRGAGLAAVAAVCRRFDLTTTRDDHVAVARVVDGEVASAERTPADSGEPPGTSVSFEVDGGVFPARWSPDVVRWRLFELACLCPGLVIQFHGERLAGTLVDLLPGGRLGGGATLREGTTRDGHRLRLAYRRVLGTSRASTILPYINLCPLPEGGSLRDAVRLGLEGGDHRPGLQVVVDLWHPSPRYAGPLRDALDQPEVVGPISELVAALLA